MRLKSLYIKNYKNLKDINIDFLSGNGLSILIGNNGSGKSNVLEAISAIFYDSYRRNKLKHNNDYELVYIINDKLASIRMNAGKRSFICDEKIVKQDHFIEQYLPNNVIAVYSGEEDRLWEQFFKPYYNEYIRKIENNLGQDKMRLMFVNKAYWNIALLVLLLSKNETIVPFIERELYVRNVEKITLTFNGDAINNSSNEILKAFVRRINPETHSVVEVTREDLRKRIFSDPVLDENGIELYKADGEQLFSDSGILDVNVFDYLIQACMPRRGKILTSIDIAFDHGLTIEQLSEGEKKLILIKAILEFVADEKSLLLLDEPDAHIHEARKKKLYNMLLEYTNYDRQIVLTTHSPSLAQVSNSRQLIMLEESDGETKTISTDKINKIQKLTSDIWTVVEQNLFFKSTKPLILFEGKTDVKYVKRAFELLGQKHAEYRNLEIDIISINGSGNAESFITDLKEFAPSKKIVVIFDRDDSGKNGAASVLGISKHAEDIVQYNDIVKDDMIVSFIPYRDGVVNGDFLIEDYFSEDVINSLIENSISDRRTPIKNLPNLPKKIKTELETRYLSYSAADFEGFSILLSKIVDLTRA